MAMQKVGINLSVLNNISTPTINVSNSTEEILLQIPQKANEITGNFFGLGVMTALFFFLVWKLGEGINTINDQYSTIRSVGIAAGISGLMGLQMLNFGFFTEFYHVVIFLSINFICGLAIYLTSRR